MKTNLDKLREDNTFLHNEAQTITHQNMINRVCKAILKDVGALKVRGYYELLNEVKQLLQGGKK